jgi:hypothetical protein
VLRITQSIGALKKLKGPGRGFEFTERFPAEGHLSFLIQAHGTSTEVFWERDFRGARLGNNFAVLACDLKEDGGGPIPNPPYPRPTFHSLDELQMILSEIMRLAKIIFDV